MGWQNANANPIHASVPLLFIINFSDFHRSEPGIDNNFFNLLNVYGLFAGNDTYHLGFQANLYLLDVRQFLQLPLKAINTKGTG